MKKILSAIVTTLILCFSCSPKVTTYVRKSTEATKPKDNIRVYGIYEQEPEKYEMLGVVKVDGRGSENCKYSGVIDHARIEAHKIGGDAIKITKHFMPDEYNTCHRIVAKIIDTKSNGIKDMQLTNIPDTANYSVLHLYRPSGAGFLVTYQVNLGDTALCRMENNTYNSVNVTNINDSIIWARTEVKVKTPIKLEKGNEYFIKCMIGTGFFVGRPVIEVVDNNIGYYEFKKIKDGNIEKMDTIITKEGKEIKCIIRQIEKDRVKIFVYRNGEKAGGYIKRSDIKEIKRKS